MLFLWRSILFIDFFISCLIIFVIRVYLWGWNVLYWALIIPLDNCLLIFFGILVEIPRTILFIVKYEILNFDYAIY